MPLPAAGPPQHGGHRSAACRGRPRARSPRRQSHPAPRHTRQRADTAAGRSQSQRRCPASSRRDRMPCRGSRSRPVARSDGVPSPPAEVRPASGLPGARAQPSTHSSRPGTFGTGARAQGVGVGVVVLFCCVSGCVPAVCFSFWCLCHRPRPATTTLATFFVFCVILSGILERQSPIMCETFMLQSRRN